MTPKNTKYQKDNLAKFYDNPLRSYLTILKYQTLELWSSKERGLEAYY